MDRKEINPTEWLLGFGINHGVSVTGAEQVLFLSGQTSTGPDGAPMHAGNITEQARVAWSNITDALAEANMDATNIVRMNMYTTDVPAFMEAAGDIVPIWAGAGCKPVSTLLGVAALFHPDIMLELEVTAVA